jgi:hypothetical protein
MGLTLSCRSQPAHTVEPELSRCCTVGLLVIRGSDNRVPRRTFGPKEGGDNGSSLHIVDVIKPGRMK